MIENFTIENQVRYFHDVGDASTYSATLSEVRVPSRTMAIMSIDFNGFGELIKFAESLSNDDMCRLLSVARGIHNKNYQPNYVNDWTFGSLRTHTATVKYLTDNIASEKAVSLYQRYKNDLINKFPAMSNLQQTGFVSRRKKKFSDSGDELDIDRFLSHELDQWTSKQTTETRKRTAVLNFTMPASAAADDEDFVSVAAVATAVSDIVESFGISTRVVFSEVSSDVTTTEKYSIYNVVVKDYEEPLDINRMLCFGASGVMRNLYFIAEACITPGLARSGLGSPHTAEFNKVAKEITGAGAYFNFQDCVASLRILAPKTINDIIKETKLILG